MRSVAILGATGSIGVQALEIVGPPRAEACGLAAHSDHAGLVAAAARHGVGRIALADPAAAAAARAEFDGEVLEGPESAAGWCGVRRRHRPERRGGRRRAARHAGGVRVRRRRRAGQQGEPGRRRRAGDRGTRRSAAGACSRSTASTPRSPSASRARPKDPSRARDHRLGRAVPRLLGGALGEVTGADALDHPTWTMGAKITIDSATLMNKGLELIEAHHLFGIDYDAIEVVVHPQSIVHGMVRFRDGALIAHLGLPDMRVPISWALTYPQRAATPAPTARPARPLRLEFEPPDVEVFRCLALAREAGREGGTAPCVLNAANEVAVAAFLAGTVSASPISPMWSNKPWSASTAEPLESLEQVLEADRRAREAVTDAWRWPHELRHRDPRPADADLHPRAGPLRRGQGGRDARAQLLRSASRPPSASARRAPSTASARSRWAATSRFRGCCGPRPTICSTSRTCWSARGSSTRARGCGSRPSWSMSSAASTRAARRRRAAPGRVRAEIEAVAPSLTRGAAAARPPQPRAGRRGPRSALVLALPRRTG